MPGPAHYYEASGRIWPPGIVMALGLSLPACAALGLGYGWFGGMYPAARFFVFLAGPIFGGLMSLICDWALNKGHVRNNAANWLVHAVAGSLGLYLSWCVWANLTVLRLEPSLAHANPFALVFDPSALGAAVLRIFETGPHVLFGWTPTRWPLAALWAIEAVLVMVPATTGHAKDIGTYCERCRKWCEGPAHVGSLRASLDDDDLRAWCESFDWARFEAHQERPEALKFIRLSLVRCFECDQTHALIVERVEVEIDDEDNRSESKTLLVDRLLLDSASSAQLRVMFGNFGAAPLSDSPTQTPA